MTQPNTPEANKSLFFIMDVFLSFTAGPARR